MADLWSLVPVRDGCLLHSNHCKHSLCYLYYHALFTPCKMVCQKQILKKKSPAWIFLLFLFNLKELSRLHFASQWAECLYGHYEADYGCRISSTSITLGQRYRNKIFRILILWILSEITLPILTKLKHILTFGKEVFKSWTVWRIHVYATAFHSRGWVNRGPNP